MITLIATCLVYKKADEPWWGVLIPIYSTYLLFEILFGNGIKFLWLLVPFVNIYWSFKVIFRIGRVFGKSMGFGFLTLFFPWLAIWILGFGGSTYIGVTD